MIILNYLKEITVIYFLVYIYDIIESLKMALGVSSILAIVIILISSAVAAANADVDSVGPEKTKRIKSITKRFLVTFTLAVVVGLIALLLPSKDGIKLLTAVYVGDTIVSNPDVQRIGGKSVDLLEKFIDDTSKKLDPPVLPKKP